MQHICNMVRAVGPGARDALGRYVDPEMHSRVTGHSVGWDGCRQATGSVIPGPRHASFIAGKLEVSCPPRSPPGAGRGYPRDAGPTPRWQTSIDRARQGSVENWATQDNSATPRVLRRLAGYALLGQAKTEAFSTAADISYTIPNPPMKLTQANVRSLSTALSAARYSYCGGSTHGFYHYPARFSPDVARTVIELFSDVGDVVLDPFMGGGTSIIEGLALGRRMIGVDLNALAHFVADMRTTPLSINDAIAVTRWADAAATRYGGQASIFVERAGIPNLPRAIEVFIAGANKMANAQLPFPRQRAFARCALLRLGQLMLDCRDFGAPRRRWLGEKLPVLVREMLAGLTEFVAACRDAGLAKNEIVSNRTLLHRSAVGLEQDERVTRTKPRLVFTSPPYPNVHVLYHRWQYRGRRETAAPYWIAGVPDGFYASHYTGGSRTPTGRQRYFTMIADAFTSVRAMMDPGGVVVQLVGFSDESQVPEYLDAMTRAGFRPYSATRGAAYGLERVVPNRKWYAKLQTKADASREILLLHRPRR